MPSFASLTLFLRPSFSLNCIYVGQVFFFFFSESKLNSSRKIPRSYPVQDEHSSFLCPTTAPQTSSNVWECFFLFLLHFCVNAVCVNAVFLLPTLTLCIAVLICPMLVSKQVMNNLNLGQTFKVNLTSCWFLQFSSGAKLVCLLVVV